jgi:hypothetical protein
MDHSAPMLFTESVDRLSYVCQSCGTEDFRTVIRPIR